jgi:multidrug efflux pump subunit AcrA (membrane-fusion protein)
MTRGARRRRRAPAVLALVLACAGLTACREVEQASAPGYEPAKLEPLGKGDLQRVTFTAEGARRVGLRTAPVTRAGRATVVPYDALIYDGSGTAYVYTSPAPLSYLRAEVEVDRVDGDRVLLSRGPRPGTRVVTVGATEVYGAENEIGGGH